MDRHKGKSDKDIEAEEKARQEKMRGGIVPDVEVNLTDEQRRQLALSKRETEIIHSDKENLTEGEKEEGKKEEGKKEEGKKEEGKKEEGKKGEGKKGEEKKPEAKGPEKPFVDIQLQKALEILREKLAVG
jgi:hypothetical protein